jgi:hypothetical protein
MQVEVHRMLDGSIVKAQMEVPDDFLGAFKTAEELIAGGAITVWMIYNRHSDYSTNVWWRRPKRLLHGPRVLYRETVVFEGTEEECRRWKQNHNRDPQYVAGLTYDPAELRG